MNQNSKKWKISAEMKKTKNKQLKEKGMIDLSIVEGFDHPDGSGDFSFIQSYEDQLLKLCELLKKFYNKSNLIIGNGVDELIDLLFLFFKNELNFKRVLILEPGYGRYEQSILRHQLNVVKFPRVILRKNSLEQQSIDTLVTFIGQHKVDAVIFSNPGNPYPLRYSKEEIGGLLNGINKSILVVIDEAFIEYAVKSNSLTALDLTKEHKNLFVLRTFSKIYGMFGLRVGTLFNDKYLTDILRYKRKYTVPQSSISELVNIFNKNNLQKYWINTYNKNKSRLDMFLKRIDDVVIAGGTNFVLFVSDKPRSFLFKVKDVTSKFNIKGKYFYRVTIPNEEILSHMEF